jgi:hypothetical protein
MEVFNREALPLVYGLENKITHSNHFVVSLECMGNERSATQLYEVRVKAGFDERNNCGPKS